MGVFARGTFYGLVDYILFDVAFELAREGDDGGVWGIWGVLRLDLFEIGDEV